MTQPFWKRPATEGGPRRFFLGWSVDGRWTERGPLTQAEAVRAAADAIRSGHAPYVSVEGAAWEPLGSLTVAE